MASKLPQDVWALILAHVPVADRLKHCALVCTKLSRAAAAATDVLQVSVWSNNQQQQQRAEAWDSYLQHYGSHITSLVLGNGDRALTQLPCPKLLHLDISDAQPLQLGLPGVLDSCRGLTSLKLSSCTVTPDGGLSGLSVLVKLRDLYVDCVKQPGGGLATLPGSVLPSLTHLTRLDLSFMGGVEDVHHVSSLTSLSVLRISDVQGPQPLRLTPDIARGFALPASLQELRLAYGIVLGPAVFAAATQLTSVVIGNVRVEVQGGGVSSGAALLAAMAGLQQLVTLQLHWLLGIVWPAPSAAYTALTASSKLQTLVLRVRGVPVGVWEHAFPPACSCPAMQEFVASEDDGVFGCAEAVSSLVRCCPGLQDLNLRLSGGLPVAALKPLMSLTKLELFVDCTDDLADVLASVSTIAALTDLEQLSLRLLTVGEGDADAIAGAAALLPLTALRQLTDCDVRVGANLDDDEEEDVLVSLFAPNEAEEGQPPNAWLQVLEQCLAASNCPPAVTAATKQLAQQHAELTQLKQQHTERLAQQQQQNQELQQRVAQQEQQVTALQQQVATLPALQAQVQQLMALLPQE